MRIGELLYIEGGTMGSMVVGYDDVVGFLQEGIVEYEDVFWVDVDDCLLVLELESSYPSQWIETP
jgi:hypothetical protein